MIVRQRVRGVAARALRMTPLFLALLPSNQAPAIRMTPVPVHTPLPIPLTPCTTDNTLCLSEGRFLITATWTKPDGESGSAHAANLTSDSGYFWFFDPANVEIAIKTLNGCGVNGHYWVFSGGLTNLKVDIAVTDTTTNRTRNYSNPQGTAFEPATDTSAFASCSAAERAFSPDPEELWDKSTLRPVRPTASSRADTTPGCLTTDTVLCTSGRFEVTANWQTVAGESGAAHAVQLTSEAGYFWFFDPSNAELIVKTLDACSFGQGQWFFATGMTTVGVQLVATDTFTGESRIYASPLGTAFQPAQDTSAFSFCPTPTATPNAAFPTIAPTRTVTPMRTVPPGTPTLSPTTTATRTITASPTITGTRTITPSPTITRTRTVTRTRTLTATPTATRTPTITATPTATRTPAPPVTVTVGCQSGELIRCRNGFFRNLDCAYSPSDVQIHVGDTVIWTWQDGTHSTTSGVCQVNNCAPDGHWDSGEQTGPFTFTHTFTEPGTFPYYCSVGERHVIPTYPGYCEYIYPHEAGSVIVDP